ncbi:hypothetical protein F5Y11DRAFT_159960 [Daldinia sp. FL1419]|nr:hypothetical protein F5Y11DRAFT_159960 [Daldinia sp. FL1419]
MGPYMGLKLLTLTFTAVQQIHAFQPIDSNYIKISNVSYSCNKISYILHKFTTTTSHIASSMQIDDFAVEFKLRVQASSY